VVPCVDTFRYPHPAPRPDLHAHLDRRAASPMLQPPQTSFADNADIPQGVANCAHPISHKKGHELRTTFATVARARWRCLAIVAGNSGIRLPQIRRLGRALAKPHRPGEVRSTCATLVEWLAGGPRRFIPRRPPSFPHEPGRRRPGSCCERTARRIHPSPRCVRARRTCAPPGDALRSEVIPLTQEARLRFGPGAASRAMGAQSGKV
jgi:hypothetical protein